MSEAHKIVNDPAASTVRADRQPAAPLARVGHYRWVVCALLFFAATINYVDRQVIGILKTTLQSDIGWSEVEYSWIVFAFQTAYAVGLLAIGGLMDRLGTRKGFSLSVIVAPGDCSPSRKVVSKIRTRRRSTPLSAFDIGS